MSLASVVLVVLLFGCPNDASTASSLESRSRVVWRYKDYGLHSQELLSSKNHVLLQCLSCPNVTWTCPTCQLVSTSETINASSTTVELLCSQPGFHEVHLQAIFSDTTVETSFYIPLEHSPYCYIWKAALSEILEHNSTWSQVLTRVWVGTPNRHEELSAMSRDLTTQFHSVGEQPFLVSTSPSIEPNISLVKFNTSCGCWEVHIEVHGRPHTVWYELTFEVTGRNTVIMDCSIRPSRHLITWKKSNSLNLTTGTDGQASSLIAGPPKLYQDTQVAGVAIILSSGGNFITENGFRTVQPFQLSGLPPGFAVEKVVFTRSTLCLMAGGEFFVLPYQSAVLTQPTDLPSMQHLSGGGSLVISKEGGSIFISQDAGFSFEEVRLPTATAELIHSVEAHPFGLQVALIVAANSSKAQFILYQLNSQSWNTQGFTFNFNGGNLTMVFFPGAFGDLLVWEESALYYSPNGGLNVGPIQIYVNGVGTLVPVVWNSEHIKQVVTGIGGQFAVLSSDNRLFYGTTSCGYAVEIKSGEPTSSEALLYFSALGELNMITLSMYGVIVKKIPTYSLLLDTLYPPPACPFVQWKHNLDRDVYYMDMGENLTFWSSVIPRQWKANQLSFAVSNPSIVDSFVENRLTQTAVEGSMERNMTVFVQPKGIEMCLSYGQSLHNTGLLSSFQSPPKTWLVSSQQKLIALMPSSVRTLTNDSVTIGNQLCAVAVLAMQCPPGRHIRVKRDLEICPTYENLIYKIPLDCYDPTLQGQVDIESNVDKEVQYNYTLYGCPLQVPYSKPFKPTLELYDGSQFVKEVTADFVVWEFNGRIDYGYNSTAAEVGCVSEPQTWSVLLQNGTHPTQAWRSENYQHCFQEGSGVMGESTPYQILNSSGVSSIVWSGHNGIYIFVATVVAKQYSFCNLTTIFAVEVYGAPGTPLTGYLMLLSTCLVGAGILVATYFLYRHLLKTGKVVKTQ